MIRGKGGHRTNPDTIHFEQSYRNVITGMVMTVDDKLTSGNCEGDVDTFMLDISSFLNKGTVEPILAQPDNKQIMQEHSYVRSTQSQPVHQDVDDDIDNVSQKSSHKLFFLL